MTVIMAASFFFVFLSIFLFFVLFSLVLAPGAQKNAGLRGCQLLGSSGLFEPSESSSVSLSSMRGARSPPLLELGPESCSISKKGLLGLLLSLRSLTLL